MHRFALIAVSTIFLALSLASAAAAMNDGDMRGDMRDDRGGAPVAKPAIAQTCKRLEACIRRAVTRKIYNGPSPDAGRDWCLQHGYGCK
jgi:hypothetical protein